MDHIPSLTAVDLVAAYAARRLSPVEVLEAALKRLGEVDPVLNAFCLVDAERGRSMARQSEARWMRGEPMGPLDGVPVAVKDTNHLPGWPTRLGSRSTADAPSLLETPGVARLREAGAVFFGKTTTPDHGWKGITDSPLTGITRNPWDPRMTPGGSSGGSAAAVATGVCPIATAGDGGGSIRIPAGFSGTYGLKPTYGLVPNFNNPLGAMALFGTMTRTAADTGLALTVLTRPDPRDPFAVPGRDVDYTAFLGRGVAGLRIGYSRDLGFPIVDPEIAAAVEEAAGVLAGAGAVVKEVDLDLSGNRQAMGAIWRLGLAATLRNLSGEQYQRLDPGLLALIVSAREVSGSALQAALDTARALSFSMQAFHQEHDLVVSPTLPIPAFPAGIDTPDPEKYPEWFDWTPFTWPFNMSRQPAASVPCGFTRAGLPVGLQIVAAPFREDLILAASRVIERERPQPMPVDKAFG